MSEQTSHINSLRDKGVYRIEHDDRAPEFLVALANEESEGDYAYALARAVPIPGAGFAYDDTEFLIFVEKEKEEDETFFKLFTSYHDGEGLYDGRRLSDLIDTGLVAVKASEAGVSADH